MADSALPDLVGRPTLRAGRGRSRGRRVLIGLGVLVIGLCVGYAAFIHWTRIDPPSIDAALRQRSELALDVKGARAYVGSSWMGRERGLWEIHLYGEPYAMGWAHGRLGEQLHMLQEDYLFGEFEKYVPSKMARFAIKNLVRFGYRKLADFIPEQRAEELAGEAAADVDVHADFLPIYHRLVYYHSLHDITQALEHSPLLGCSAFAASGSATTTGHLVIGRNFDFEGPRPFDDEKAVLFFHPTGKIAFASVAWTGMTGVVTGINAESIFVSINAARTEDKGKVGMPVELLMRQIMEEARSVDDVVRMVKDTPVLVPDFYLVGDGKTGESAVIERSPTRVEVRKAHADVSLLTNHALAPAFAADAENDRLKRYLTSGARFRRMEELVRRYRGSIDPKRALEILRDKRGAGGEVLGLGNRNALDAIIATHSVVVDATSMTLWVGAGPHLLGRFVGFDLRKELGPSDGGADHSGDRPDPPDLPPDPLLGTEELRVYEEALAHMKAAAQYATLHEPGAPQAELDELERAAALQDHMPEPQRLLGDLYRKRGNTEAARRAYTRFLELQPPYLKDVEEVKGILGTL